MNTTRVGQLAEVFARQYLKTQGYQVVDTNWRTRWCEIDIVAEKRGVIYFVEVKYRRQLEQSSGLDHITPTKLKQMVFAAQLWLDRHAQNKAWELSAVEVTGQSELAVTAHLPQLT